MKKILIFGGITLLFGCLSKKYISDTGKYPGQIAKQFYSLSKSPPNYSSLIDTSSVYLFASYRTFDGEPQLHRIFRFMRFSNEGTVFMSSSYSGPVPDLDYDLMPSGEFCRYKLENNELIIEDYQYRLRKFKMLHADIKGDSICFTYYKLRTLGGGKGRIDDEVYLRKEIALKTRVIFPE